MAKRKIEERDRIDDVFKVVYGEVPKEYSSKDTYEVGSGAVTAGQSQLNTTPILDEDTAIEMACSSTKNKPVDPQEVECSDFNDPRVVTNRSSKQQQNNFFQQDNQTSD